MKASQTLYKVLAKAWRSLQEVALCSIFNNAHQITIKVPTLQE